MAWTYVALAAFIEVFWVIGLTHSETFLEWAGTVVAIILSFIFIIKACESLPSGTVYAVFTGSGAAAIVLIDYVLFNAEMSATQFMFIGLIIIGVVGIQMTTEVKDAESLEKGDE